ncbi:MAG: NUDIX hydrolase [Bdellovibrionales bacterium]|nr:NUDIX hydrolase [Bdellovibrionales bacterium]
MKSWKQIQSEVLLETPYVNVRVDRCAMPDGRVVPQYYVLDSSDWANVVALDKNNQLVMVRQYRYAGNEVCLEFPGGVCEEESAEAAVTRELLEETGYRPQTVKLLGVHRPNPALQSNFLYSFLALDCEKVATQNLDPHEEIEVELLPVSELWKLVQSGQFSHSLMLASLMLAHPYLQNLE